MIKKKLHRLQILLTIFLCNSVMFSTAQNQNKSFADFGNGSYDTYKMEKSFDVNNTPKYKFEKVSKQWPVAIQQGSGKDFEGNTIIESVVISRQGVIKENFVPDIKENPVYFGYKDFRITVIGDKIYQYEWSSDNANIIYILSKIGLSNYQNEKEILEKYVRNSFKTQLTARGKINEVKAANEEKAAAESSLKGKKLKSISIEMLDVPTVLAAKTSVRFGIKAIATDGKIYSTSNIGGSTKFDDFKITTNDGIVVDDAIELNDDASKISNDELNFTVASKYTPEVTAQKTISLNYAFKTYNIIYNGSTSDEITSKSMFSVYNGGNARPLEVKIQKSTTKKTNLPIYKVEVIESATGKVLNRVKISENTILNIQAAGGSSSKGRSDTKARTIGSQPKAGDGGNGGDGGNVTISKSADVKNLQINVMNKGARGSSGGTGISLGFNGLDGKDGKDGVVIEKSLSANLNW